MSVINLTSEQLAQLIVLRSNKKYPAMYSFLHKVVVDRIALSPNDSLVREWEKTANWLSAARAINSNDRSFFSDMVRGSIQFAVATTGRPLSDAGFQVVSDGLAEDVANTFIRSGAIISPQDIIGEDVNAAVRGFGLQQWNWPGTLGDQLPSPFGLGQDFVQVTGDGRVEYAKNLGFALMQNVAGLKRYMDRDSLFDQVPLWKLSRNVNKWIGDNLYRAFPNTVDTPVELTPQQLIDINITPSPKPQQTIQDETQSRQDVSNGFAVNLPTHSISFKDGLLNKTDFTSTQMGSLATGGIRPGEIQPDPNARPNSYLSQFYLDRPTSSKPDFGLLNAVTLNGLAAMTTVNTYVDPLLLDLTGKGVRMTDLRDGVLFDTDHSGTLKRTGWADRSTGMLVVDDGSGQIKDVSQMFSEYYAGKFGVGGAAGEARFKDGFAALASEDSNTDGVIDHHDPIWSKLRVWVDVSHDAKTDAGELKTMA